MGSTGGLRRGARLYRRSLGAHMRATLEYEADFWLLVFAAILTQVVGLVFLGAVFARVPHINGWDFADVALIFSLVVIAEGIGSLFFEGTWRLAWRVNQGEIDYLLVRPYPVVLQVMSADVGLNGLGNLVSGGVLLGWSLSRVDVAWSVGTAAAAVVLFASAILIKLAINLATNASSFWLQGPFSIFAYAMHQVGDLARFPLTVYTMGIRAALTLVVPFAFVSFFPAGALLERGEFAWVGWLTPLVAAYCLGMAALIFRRGLRRYESTGS
ncbi:MAG TPA: ABC-2 family transporter protein [Micromonosporaceae bacterium]|nr:ABC-2 family transporter protein [Micromonosporaceae bacterium]